MKKGTTKIIKKEYKRMFEVMNYMLRAEIAAWGNTLWNKKIHGYGSRDFIMISRKNKIQAFMNASNLLKAASAGYKNLTNSKFVKKDWKETRDVLDSMYEQIALLKAIHLESLSNTDLGAITNEYFNRLLNVYGRFQTSVGWYTAKVEDEIRQYLGKRILNPIEREDVLRSLARPFKRFDFEEEEIGWLKIIIQAKKTKVKQILQRGTMGKMIILMEKNYPKLYKDILLHQQKYEWLTADSNLLPFTMGDCVHKLKEMINLDQSSINNDLVELLNRQKKVLKENKEINRKYKIAARYQRLFSYLQEYAYIRFCIRFCWTQGMYYSKKLYIEVAKRADINPQDVLYCLSTELMDFLLHNKPINKKSLRLRKELYVIFLKDYKLQLYTGKKAEELEKYVKSHYLIESMIENKGILKGQIGSPGKVTGRVKILTYDKPLPPQIEAMNKGDILVAGQTRPEIIVACRKAGAIVTNEGGIASHAAVVSREFNIPCVIGTKIATDVFKDGDLVEVDANNGIIKKL